MWVCMSKINYLERSTLNKKYHNTTVLINKASLAFMAILFCLEEPRTDGGWFIPAII